MPTTPIDLFQADAPHWSAELIGAEHGSGMSLILLKIDDIGQGPDPHLHPYEEVFIIRQGRAAFTLGDAQVEVRAGQVVIAPPGVRHGFKNLGPGTLETIDIHAADRFETTWVD